MSERDDILTVAADAEASGRPDAAAELRASVLPPVTPIEEIRGKTMSSVERHGDEHIDFVAVTGERYRMYHESDCCETCTIEDVVGDLEDLVGVPLAMAEAETSCEGAPKNDYDDSFTWTFFKFATAKGYVTVRWYGASNGYYSEQATFARVQ